MNIRTDSDAYDTHYRRTENGFVAFVGIRGVGYVDSEGLVRYDLVR